MLSLAPYLVTPSGLTSDAGITAGHYLHIFCQYHHASGAVITRKAAFKKNKGKKKSDRIHRKRTEVRYLLFIILTALQEYLSIYEVWTEQMKTETTFS